MIGDLLKRGTLAEMLKGRALPEHANAHPDAAYGLGLMLWANDPLGHMGEGPGSKIAILAQGRSVAAVWAASTSSLDAEAYAIGLLS